MKKNNIFLFFLIVFFIPHPIFAAPIPINITAPDQVIGGTLDINDVIKFVIQLLVVVGVLASLIFLIYGGIKWITSGGDKTAVEGARGHVVAAIIGLVVVILSFVIISFVLQLLGVDREKIFKTTIEPPTQQGGTQQQSFTCGANEFKDNINRRCCAIDQLRQGPNGAVCP